MKMKEKEQVVLYCDIHNRERLIDLMVLYGTMNELMKENQLVQISDYVCDYKHNLEITEIGEWIRHGEIAMFSLNVRCSGINMEILYEEVERLCEVYANLSYSSFYKVAEEVTKLLERKGVISCFTKYTWVESGCLREKLCDLMCSKLRTFYSDSEVASVMEELELLSVAFGKKERSVV